MKAEDRRNKTPIPNGILHPPKAKPHIKTETVLYHQPILTSPTTRLPPELCPTHPQTLTHCGCVCVCVSLFLGEELCGLLHPLCTSPLSAVHIAEDQKSSCIVPRRATHTLSTDFDTKDSTCTACFVFSSYHWLLLYCVRGKMARHLPRYTVRSRRQATGMPIKISPISGLVCELEPTNNKVHLSITHATTLQAAGLDYTQG